MPDYRYSLVDVFAANPLEGNLLPVIEGADEIPDATTEFAASNAGGGLRPLPPASFYHS